MSVHWRKSVLFAMAIIAALLAAAEAVFAQCAMCKTALLNSPEGQKMASGFNNAILFLLGAPFVIIGMMAFLVFKARLKIWFLRATARRSKPCATTFTKKSASCFRWSLASSRATGTPKYLTRWR